MRTSNTYGYSENINERAMQYIEREIKANQTYLVTDALNSTDEIAGLCVENIKNYYFSPTGEGDYTEPQEIFEWYLISEWLAKKLDALGEPILYGSYNHYWGRTCTGQPIIMDTTFQSIAQLYL